MSLQDKEMLRLLSSIVIIIFLPMITAILGWGMLRLVDHETRLAVVESNQFAIKEGLDGAQYEIKDHERRLNKGNL